MASSTVTQIADNGQSSVGGSLHWAIEPANETAGNITLTAGADITITRQSLPLIVDSNATTEGHLALIGEAGGRFSISSSPLFDGNTYVFDDSANEESNTNGGSVSITTSGLIRLDTSLITVRPTNEIVETNRQTDSNATIPLRGEAGGSISLTSRLIFGGNTYVVDDSADEESPTNGGSIQISASGGLVIEAGPIMVTPTNEIVGTNRRDVLQGTNKADRILGRSGNDELIGDRGNDTIDGSNGNDRLLGNAGRDRLNGGQGRDRLFGGAGNDTLSGGTGNDFLVGGVGSDRLEGGQGRDVLIGGGGRDTFVLASSGQLRVPDGPLDVFLIASAKPVSVRDVISDFKAGQDKIEVIGLSFGALSFEGNRISIAETDEVIASLTGIDTTTLSAADFV